MLLRRVEISRSCAVCCCNMFLANGKGRLDAYWARHPETGEIVTGLADRCFMDTLLVPYVMGSCCKVKQYEVCSLVLQQLTTCMRISFSQPLQQGCINRSRAADDRLECTC